MTLINLPPEKKLLLSYSSENLWDKCNRLFEFRKIYNYPGWYSSLDMEVGSAFHAGFQHYLVHNDVDKAIWEMMKNYPVELCQNGMEQKSIEATYAALFNLINERSLIGHSIASIMCLDGITRPAIEVPFEVEITGFDLSPHYTSVSYIGYIDAIFHTEDDGRYIVTDFKTTGKKPKFSVSEKYTYAEQCIPYGMVLEYMLGRKISNFEIKYIQIFIDSLDPRAEIYAYDKTEEDVRDWFKGLLIRLNQIKLSLDMNWFARHSDACTSYGRSCDHLVSGLCNIRDSGSIKEVVQNAIDTAEEEANRDEALVNKRLRPVFEPWVKFSIVVEGV